MWSKKDWVIFFAGIEVFHTLSHIALALSGALPVEFFFVMWTEQLNRWGIIINAAIALGLLWWAYQLSCCERSHKR